MPERRNAWFASRVRFFLLPCNPFELPVAVHGSRWNLSPRGHRDILLFTFSPLRAQSFALTGKPQSGESRHNEKDSLPEILIFDGTEYCDVRGITGVRRWRRWLHDRQTRHYAELHPGRASPV